MNVIQLKLERKSILCLDLAKQLIPLLVFNGI